MEQMQLKTKLIKNEYPEAFGCTYVDKKWLEARHSTEEITSFTKWMDGQTGMILDDGSLAFYSWDYERWINNLPVID